MRFFTRLGIPAPRETHTRLYVNGDYAGLYGLVESVDKTMMGRVFGSIGDNVQNDGYLFEYNYVLGSPWRFTLRGPGPGALQGALRHQDQREPRRVADLGADRGARPAGQQHSRQRSFEQTIGPRLDLPAFVRYIAGAELHRPERRLQRLRRDEQLLLLPAREQHRATCSSRGTRTTRSCSRTSASRRAIDENVLTRKTLELPAYPVAVLQRAVGSGGSAADWLRQEMQRQFDMINDGDARPTRSSRISNAEYTGGSRNAAGVSGGAHYLRPLRGREADRRDASGRLSVIAFAIASTPLFDEREDLAAARADRASRIISRRARLR